jgi:hypothetical protein
MLIPRPTVSRMAIATCMLALTLSACQKSATTDSGQPTSAPPIAALALATASPPAPMAYAPPVTALPAAAARVPARLRHGGDRYGYTDRAYAMSRAFGDTPPDYTVDYDGTRPWVWRSDDGSYRVVEQLPNGQRSYYYQRGADRPFYITDPDGGYAYDGGQLVGLYGPDGSPLPDMYAQQRAEIAARYYDRSAAVYHAVQYSRRQAAYADEWQVRRSAVVQQQQRWDEARTRNSDWTSWHDQHQQDEDRAWQGEQDRRAAYAVAIGAAAVGVVGLLSGHHDDNGQYHSAPPAANRRDNGPPMPQGGGYAQRPHDNGPPAGNRDTARLQQQPPAVAQPYGLHPNPSQSPRAPGAFHPQPQAAYPVPQARAPMPTHQGGATNRAFAPAGAPGLRSQPVMAPHQPSPVARDRPLAAPRPPVISRPVEPIAVTRPPFEHPVRPTTAPLAPRLPEHPAAPEHAPPVPHPMAPHPVAPHPVAPHPTAIAPSSPPRAPFRTGIIQGKRPHPRPKQDGMPQN